MLEAYRGSQRTVLPNGPEYVSCIEFELGLADCLLANDGQRNSGGLASILCGCPRGAPPLALIRTSRIGIAELCSEQQAGDSSDQQQAFC
jgi:hypothetical protein